MHDELTKRFTRQMVLPEIGQDGQQLLQDSHALIIGLGGLGSAATIYLAAAGIGKLTLNDYDRVDLSNLHRQVLYGDDDVGKAKTAAAGIKLQQAYPTLAVDVVNDKMDYARLCAYCKQADVVLDCSDNFATRHLINRATVTTNTPLVSAAAIRLEGQISVFNHNKDSPCYACLYPDVQDQTERCSEVGVIGPLLGVIGSMQALEAVKVLTTVGELLDGRLLLFDAAAMHWRAVTLNKDTECSVCSTN